MRIVSVLSGAALVASVSLAGFVGLGEPSLAAASASEGHTGLPSKADKRAMVKANRGCAEVESEVAYEDCVIGAFVLSRHRYIDENDFTTDFSRDSDHYVRLIHTSTKI